MLSERNESKIANAVFHESFMEHRRHAETNPRTREGFLTAAKAGNRPDSTNIKNEVFLLDDSEKSRIFADIYEKQIMKERWRTCKNLCLAKYL